jgi:hypothetical protein
MPVSSARSWISLAGDVCVEVVEERCVVELGVEVRQRPVTCPTVWAVGIEALDDVIEGRGAVFERESQVEQVTPLTALEQGANLGGGEFLDGKRWHCGVAAEPGAVDGVASGHRRPRWRSLECVHLDLDLQPTAVDER